MHFFLKSYKKGCGSDSEQLPFRDTGKLINKHIKNRLQDFMKTFFNQELYLVIKFPRILLSK